MFKSFVLAAALAFTAAAPVLVQTAPATAAPVPDAENVAMAEQIITNLGMIDVMIHGYDQGVRESSDFADMTDAQKERYIVIFNDLIEGQRAALTHKLAVNTAPNLTRDEMASMLALSKIGYLKAVVQTSSQGAPAPDPAMMSADEKALYDKYQDADFVGRFLDGVDVDLVGDDIIAIGAAAYDAWAKEAGIAPAH